MSRIERDENGYEFQPTTWGTRPSVETLTEFVKATRTAFEEFNATVAGVVVELHRAGLVIDEATATRRRDTLHREAAAALGRGDRATHRKKLAELRRLPRRHP